MAHGWLSAGLMGVAALLVGAQSQAEGLRCGDALASTGASLYEVRATCGDPDDAQHTVETRTVPQTVSMPCGTEHKLCSVVVYQSVQVSIDRWTYDFGSNRFIEFARFEDGNLVRVSNGPYGRKDPS